MHNRSEREEEKWAPEGCLLLDSEKIGENAEIARNFRVLCFQTNTFQAIYYNINMVHIIILYKLLLDVGNADT